MPPGQSPAPADAIGELSANFPNLIVGAGTVLSIEQAEIAVSKGARLIVTPGFDHQVVEWCLKNGVLCTPGVVTPSEINLALRYGIEV
ncbi:2-dehydro-3-deoxyphosphogluconate aldolase, partial [Chloroflexota bacterium]